MEAQNKLIRAWLESGRPITPLDALRHFGCLRLAARISDLKETGLNIVTEMVNNNGKRYAQYTLTR